MDPVVLQFYANLYTQWGASNGVRCDAAESIVFARELLRVRTAMIKEEFPELKATRLMARNSEVQPLDEAFAVRTMKQYGTTATGSDYATQSPRADVAYTEETPQRIRPITSSYGYNFFEAQRAASLGRPLLTDRAQAARETVAFEVERILKFGDTTHYGVTLGGMLTQSGTLTFTPATGAGGSKLWTLKTPDEILSDLNGIAVQPVTNSNDIEHPNTLLVPLARHDLISRTRLGDGSDVTILRHFLANSPYIKRVEPWYALDAAPNSEWTGMRMMAYDNSPSRLEYLLPVEFRQHAPQMQGFETVIPCDARIGGVVVYRPKSISYGDGI